MLRTKLISLVFVALFSLSESELASAQSQSPDDQITIKSIIEMNVDKTITIKLIAGDELTGVVKAVSDSSLHLSGLLGKEYYDAFVSMDVIAAVIVRARSS